MPSNDRNVRNLFPFSELKANDKLSSINQINSIFYNPVYCVKIKNLFKYLLLLFVLI